MPVLATNKGALHDYEVLETYEAGIVLSGQEVKSIRDGTMKLKGAYAALTNGTLWLLNAHIPSYRYAGPLPNYDPTRSRKLLLTKKELQYVSGKISSDGLTVVPLRVYTLKSRIKVALVLCRGKRQFEKRELLKKRVIDREIQQELKRR